MSNSNSVSSSGLTGRPSIPEAEAFIHVCGLWNAGCPAFAGHDIGGDVTPHSRGTKRARVMHRSRPLESKRAQGMPVQRTHPQPCVQWKKARKQVTTGTPKRRHSLRNGLTAYTCSPWCTGLFSHHRSTIRLAELDPSVGRSGPHDFAVRAGRARLARQHVHRIPRPTSVTIAIRPSCGCETCGLGPLICPTAQAMLPATD
jgi:hypothetical protein